MKVKLKKGVNPNITVSFAMGVGWLKAEWEHAGLGTFRVTSLKDGGHKSGSDHKQDQPSTVEGEAADISTWKHWIWTDTEARDHYGIHGQLPPGKLWTQVGHHDDNLLLFATRIQQEGFKVVVHPEHAETVPHLHVAERPPGFFEREL